MPGIDRENYWFRRHEVVYEWIGRSIARREILGAPGSLAGASVIVDAGCGEGYGAAALAAYAERCVAVDLDLPTVSHVRCAYDRPRLNPVVANLDALPVGDSTADVVVSLQVIEHLWDLPRFLRECRRVLRPGGKVVISTPNRLTFSPGLGRGERPLNPFHVEEFDPEQLIALLGDAGLRGEEILGLRHGPRIQEWEASNGSLVRRQVDAVLGDGWTRDLDEFVGGVTATDFLIERGDSVASLDLIAVGTKRFDDKSAPK